MTLSNKENNDTFIFQFYHLASVRLQDLCNRLELYEEDLRKKIWTCFEYSVMKHSDLMQDRHLDQILMCAVYVICKVSCTVFPCRTVFANCSFLWVRIFRLLLETRTLPTSCVAIEHNLTLPVTYIAVFCSAPEPGVDRRHRLQDQRHP